MSDEHACARCFLPVHKDDARDFLGDRLCHHYSRCVALLRSEVADRDKLLSVVTAERDAAREALRWIPVSERLPDIAVDVLIYNANDCGQITIGYVVFSLSEPGWKFCDANEDVSVSCVSHWMPLPEPPK